MGEGEPPIAFSELVYAHYGWWRQARTEHGATPEATAAYHAKLARFEREHGRIVTSFWCTHLESGIALTERQRTLGRESLLAMHRETDWATKQFPEIAVQLHRCDELAIKARTVLTGVRQRICLHLVATAAGHLLSLVDSASSPETSTDLKTSLAAEQEAVARAERYYKHAANGQAEIVYFAGMATVALAIAVVAGLVLQLEWKVGVAALVAGALGAVVSVIQRINARAFHIDYDVGKPYAFFLGGLRPLIGGAFAITLAFAFDSKMLHLPVPTNDTKSQHLALVVISFLAGFSERFAQDTLASVLPQARTEPEPQTQTPTTTTSAS